MPETQTRSEHVREMYEHVSTYWNKDITFAQERIDMYYDEDTVVIPDTMNRKRRRRVQPERMTANEVARQIDLIVSFYPIAASIGVQYTGAGSRSTATADKIEIALGEAIDQLNPPTDSPLLRERWQMVLLGRSARMIVPGHMYWWDFPHLKEGESLDEWDTRYREWGRRAPLPLVWVDLPAETTYPSSFGTMEDEVMSWMNVTKSDLKSMFSVAELADLVESKPGDVMTLCLYSDRKYLTYSVMSGEKQGLFGRGGYGDKIIREVEHKLGRSAIRILPGNTTGKKEPGRFWRGVADSSIALIKSANKRLSEAATGSKLDSMPILKAWLQEEEIFGEGAQSRNTTWLEGDIIPLRNAMGDTVPKEDIQPLFQPAFGDKTLALAQWALNRAERNSGAVEALEGMPGPAGEPAWSRNAVIDTARVKHSRLSFGVAAADLDAAGSIIDAMVAFGEEVRLRPQRGGEPGPEIVLRPSELVDYKAILKAEYKMKLPVNKRADLDMMMSMIERSLNGIGAPISPAWVMETIGEIEQPYEMYKEWLTWRWLMSPEIQKFYIDLLKTEAGLESEQDEGMAIDEGKSVV